MKRIFAFLCALVLFLTGFPITAGFGAEMDIVAEETAQDLVVVEPKEKELFPDLPPNTTLFSTRNTALEHTLPDGFMEYLLEHFGNCEASFSIEQFNIPYSRWEELKPVIWYETPELFHVKTLGCTYYQSADIIVDVTVTYLSYADTAAEYETCLSKMLSGAEYLLQNVKGNNALTDVEKALVLHDRLAIWTEYDVEGANTTNTYNKIHTAYSALGEGAAVCQGYAMAYMYLLEQAGIESDYCSSDVLNHGWNIVYIDGVAYHTDVTWDDPITSNATYNDVYGRVNHKNFLLSSNGIWNTGHEASDYNTTPTDTRYDSESATTWWKASTTAVQLIDNNLYYLDKNSGKVIFADDGSTIHTLADSSSAYKLSSAEGMLLCSTFYDVKTIDPKTGASSVFYTVQNGYMEGMKYEEGKLWVQLNDGNGNSRRESMDYVEPELTEYTYTVEDGKATIIGYTGIGGDITIPATLGGYPVTQIGENAFNNCTTLTSVTIPDSVTTIDSYAFHWCESLISVTIPDSVLAIGDAAFNGCDRLASVTIGNSVTTIGSDAFRGCPSLTSITIPDSVTAIGESAFSNCTGLTSVTIPSKVTTISNYLFYFCPNLTSVTIPDGVTYIGAYAFGDCPELTDVYYDGTESQWEAVSVGTGNGCLQNATIHYIDYTYTVENGEATITGYTGAGGDITIPATLGGYPVTLIGENAFYGCTSLTSVGIPDGVTKIGEGAFLSCNKLTTVNIPDSVTIIGECAFYGCSYLNGVEIPNSVTKIGVDAFAGCIRLTSITIPSSVTAIYEGTFYYCENLTSVTIPDSITYIGESAFANCTKLTDVYYDGTEEQWNSISLESGNECLQNATVHFPEPEKTDYTYTVENSKATITGYNGTGGDITIPDTLGGCPAIAIGDNAFRLNTSLSKVTIPDSVTSIGFAAFSGCTGLKAVTIGNGVTTIGNTAFFGCRSLSEVTIPSRVAAIGYAAFSECTGLTSVTIPNGVKSIGDEAFYNCNSLTSLTIPDSVTTIGGKTFAYCSKLQTIEIPDSITSIGYYAFLQCTGLETVTIGNGISTIGTRVFADCTALTSVTLDSSVTTVGQAAFENCTKLTDVYYDGTEEQWKTISVETGNECLQNATIHCTKEPEAPEITDYTYTVENGEATITGYIGTGGDITIPDTLGGYPVTEIGEWAFHSCTSLTSVTIPDSVTTIGGFVFYYCENLTSVTIPYSVTYIGERAFEACPKLTDVYYIGTQEQWESVSVGEGNEYLQNATIHFAKHSHSYTENIVEPTCTDGGYTTYTCTCGDAYVDNQVDALGHSFTNYESDDNVTCVSDGTETAKCDRCEETHTRVQEGTAKGHSFTNYESDDNATCISDGTETAKCDRCEETHTRVEEGTVKGHDCEAVVFEPTCLDIGFAHYECSRCDYAYDDNWVEALGHSYTNACDTTCNRSDCGATRKITHSYATATCTKPKTCKVCKATSGKALGHSYKSGRCTRCKYKPVGAKITTQPVNVAVKSGKTAKVTVKATGSGLKYTWYYAKKGSSKYTKTTVTTASYSVKMSNSVNGGKVYCVVTDQYGNAMKSNTATLYKGTAAKITTQPKGTTVASGKTGKLTIKASGSSLKYQWYIKYKGASSFTKVGKSSKTYSFKMASKLNGAQVYCVVKDKYGIEVKSSVVSLKMPIQPKVTTQPKSAKAFSGKTVKFTVKASGEGLKYQWYYAKKGSSKFKKLSAKSATYSVKVSSSVNGRKYYCLVTDKYGQTVKSSVVTLTMQSAAKITTQPKNVSVKNNKTAKVTIKATGDGLKYTWYYLLTGQTKYQKATVTGNTFSVKMAAKYKNTKAYCVVADRYGNSVKSKTVTLKMK